MLLAFRSVLLSFFIFLPALSHGQWSFYVFSDIHVYQDGTMPKRFHELVRQISRRNSKPEFIMITGDSTVGNPGDSKEREALAPMWWKKLQEALTPLSKAGIPIYVVSGNHDAYTEGHRSAYAAAWVDMLPGGWFAKATNTATGFIELSQKQSEVDKPPFSYSFQKDGVLFIAADIVKHDLEENVRSWLEKELDRSNKMKIVFGHVPFVSVMGRDSNYFATKMKKLFGEKKVTAYVSGHEHIFWDEFIETPSGHDVREVIVGTASATYNYGFLERVRERISCRKKGTTHEICRMPASRKEFTVKRHPNTKWPYRQVYKQVFTEIKVLKNDIEVIPHTLVKKNNDSFAIEPFYEQTVK